jgi:hypothetical protein
VIRANRLHHIFYATDVPCLSENEEEKGSSFRALLRKPRVIRQSVQTAPQIAAPPFAPWIPASRPAPTTSATHVHHRRWRRCASLLCLSERRGERILLPRPSFSSSDHIVVHVTDFTTFFCATASHSFTFVIGRVTCSMFLHSFGNDTLPNDNTSPSRPGFPLPSRCDCYLERGIMLTVGPAFAISMHDMIHTEGATLDRG